MSKVMQDWLADLSDILRDGEVKVTFSKNCYSGIASVLGAGTKCICGRCLRERGETPTEETEQQAEENNAVAQKHFRELMRAYFCEK